ncbi:hypothetical protein ACS0TY_024232 [Phlomoides rotata]
MTEDAKVMAAVNGLHVTGKLWKVDQRSVQTTFANFREITLNHIVMEEAIKLVLYSVTFLQFLSSYNFNAIRRFFLLFLISQSPFFRRERDDLQFYHSKKVHDAVASVPLDKTSGRTPN